MRSLDPEIVLRKTEKGKIEILMEQYQKYSDGESTCLQFVKSLGYKFGEHTNM
jgi:hypothetical protein